MAGLSDGIQSFSPAIYRRDSQQHYRSNCLNGIIVGMDFPAHLYTSATAFLSLIYYWPANNVLLSRHLKLCPPKRWGNEKCWQSKHCDNLEGQSDARGSDERYSDRR